jgi:type IV pilus assembly protein PilM
MGGFLSIDIGFKYIKILELKESAPGRLKLVRFGIGDTPKESMSNGMVKKIDDVREEIEKIIKKFRLKGDRAKVVVSGTNILSRILFLELLSEESLEDKIQEKIFDISNGLGENSTDYKVISREEKEGKIFYKIFITIVSNKIIESYKNLLKKLSIKPVAIDIPANSIAKVLGRGFEIKDDGIQKGDDDKTTAVLDLGSETTIINFFKGSSPEFNRVLLEGSNNIDLKIMERLGLESSKEAEELKIKTGLCAEDDKDENHNIADESIFAVDRVLENYKNCVDFYKKRCGGNKPEKIFLIGGGSYMKGIEDYIEKNTGTETYSSDRLKVKDISVKKSIDDSYYGFLINAIGAAL